MEKTKIKYYSPLRYPGGKSCIYPFIKNLLIENKLHNHEYAEPYAGGAGVALRLLLDNEVKKIHINDLDPAIFTFWKTVLDSTEELCEWINTVQINIQNWQHYKNIYNNHDKYKEFELGTATFFLNRTNISGVLKGGLIGGVNQKGKYKMNARFNRVRLIEQIQAIASKKSQIKLSNEDGVKFITRMNKYSKNLIIYLDPPYVNKGSNLYMNYFSSEDHKLLSETVKKLDNKWFMSYDTHPLINELYAGLRKIRFRLSQCTSNKVGDEILIFGPNIKFNDAIQLINSPEILS